MSTKPPNDLLGAAIASNDADDRLALAAWYEETGDAVRARVIRLSIELHGLGHHDRRALEVGWELAAARSELGDRWRDELPVFDGIEWTTLDRGLASGVKVRNLDALYEHATAIRAVAPVTRVEVRRLEPAGDHKPLRWLRTVLVTDPPNVPRATMFALTSYAPEIEIDGADHDDLGWLGRAKTSRLERLVVLRTSAVGARLAKSLASASWAASLTTLRIGTRYVDPSSGYNDDPRLGEEGAAQLAKLTSLEVLDVNRQHIGATGLGKLATLPALRELSARQCCTSLTSFAKARGESLEALDLSNNAFGLAAVKQLAKAPRAAAVQRLVLDTCEIDAFALGELTTAPMWPHLRVLDVSRNPLGASGIRTLASAPRPALLHTLEIEDIDLDETGPEAIAKIPWLAQLAVLDLSGNPFAHGITALRGVALEGLRHLAMSSTKMGRSEATLISPLWSRLVHLDLGNNPLTDGGLDRFGLTKPAPLLQSLTLRDCNLGDDAIDLLYRVRAPRLRSLDLAGNTFGPRGLYLLLQSPLLANVESLNLSRCKLSVEALALLATTELPPRLRTLKLRHNQFAPDLLLALAESKTLARVRDVFLSGNQLDLPAPTQALLARRFGSLWYQDPKDPLVE